MDPGGPWRFVPLIAIALFYGVGFVWRTWLHWRRYGATGIMLFRSGGVAQKVRDSLILVLVAVLFAQAIVAVGNPSMLNASAAGRWLGAAVVAAGIGLMVRAQLELGASWRVGIEEGASPGLVTHGLYRFSRNPIFVAMLTAIVGFTLLVPTWVTVVLLVGAFVGIRRQVIDEEDYLRRAYGDAYLAYARRVGRFLPGLGRLS